MTGLGRLSLPHPRRPVGYRTIFAGDLASELDEAHIRTMDVSSTGQQPDRWAPVDTALLARILDGLDRL